MHMLFANFDADECQAQKLALLIIDDYDLDPNLQDTEGKTAIHVAIAKQQHKALHFAFLYNFQHRALGS